MEKKILMLAPAVLLFCSCTSIIPHDRPELSVPHTSSSPVIDGSLTDKEWQAAGVIKGLKPCLGGKYLEKIDRVPTEIRLLWTEDFLFIGFFCIDDDIFNTGTMKHDDNLYQEDVCEVFIDPFGDGRQYIEIQVSPENEILDLMYLMTKKPEYTKNLRLKPDFNDRWGFREWDLEGLKTATAPLMKDGKKIGWTTEIAIPAAILAKRYGKKNLFPMTMRANFMRYDYQPDRKGRKSMVHMNWAPVQHGCPHISAAAMGYLKLEE